MSENLEPRIKDMIVERLFLDIDPATLDPAASLTDVYGVDSVSLLELVVGIEEVFDIPMGDEDFNIAHFENVRTITDFVRQRLP